MREPVNDTHTRRQLLRGTLRKVSLALLGAGGGAAVVKRRKLVREGRCTSQGICPDCAVFGACGLPRALSVKRAMARSYQNG